ncbi:MAG: CHAT domain-containing protein [Bacteroidota bacterium]
MFFKGRATVSKALFYLLILVFARCSTPSIVATKSIQLGDFHNNQRNHVKAIEHYEEYLQASENLGMYRNTETEADVHRKLAHSRSALGEYTVAEKHVQQAKELDSLINKNELTLLEDMRLLGMLKAYQGNYGEAISILTDVLNRSSNFISSSKSVNKQSVVAAYLSLARLKMVLGDFSEAFSLLKEAESMGSGLTNYEEYADEITLVQGIINREQGNLEKAEAFIKQSIRWAKESGRLPARQFEANAQIELLKGNYEEALRHQLDAYKFSQQIGISAQIVNSLLRLGDIYKAIGDDRAAEESYLKALRLRPDVTSERISNSTSYEARLQSNLDMYEFQGAKTGAGLAAVKLLEYKLDGQDWNDLDSLISAAERNFSSVGSEEGLSRTLLGKARFLCKKQKYAEALDALDSAGRLSKQPDLQWKVFYRKGLIYVRLNDYNNAKTNYENSISVVESIRDNLNLDELKSAFFSNKVEVYEAYIDLLLKQYRVEAKDQLLLKAFALNERSRARSFLDMLGNRKVGSSAKNETVVKSEQQLRVKIQQLVQQISEADQNSSRRALTTELEWAQSEYQQVLLDIKLNHPGFDNLISVEPPDLSRIQNNLNDSTIMVEYWLGKDEITIWLIEKDEVGAVQVKIAESEIRREMAAFRNAVSLQMSEFMDRSLEKLYGYLIEPIAEKISAYQSLIIIPNGVVHFLPFQALKNQAGHYLIENFLVSTAPSASVWFHCQQLSASEFESKFLGMALGNSTLGQFPALPGTLLEVDKLATLYQNSDIRNGNNFSEGFFKTEAPGYDYLHVATHGVLNTRQPGYSYLLMHPSEHEDGRLTVNEIFNIRLKARLVTLSACETGLGELSKGDDLIGLSRAFIYSGSPAVIVSLWKVDDATTSLLMTRFHEYLESGNSVAESLTLAQRSMIKNGEFTDDNPENMKGKNRSNDLKIDENDKLQNPYFWAPFILIGH